MEEMLVQTKDENINQLQGREQRMEAEGWMTASGKEGGRIKSRMERIRGVQAGL